MPIVNFRLMRLIIIIYTNNFDYIIYAIKILYDINYYYQCNNFKIIVLVDTDKEILKKCTTIIQNRHRSFWIHKINNYPISHL